MVDIDEIELKLALDCLHRDEDFQRDVDIYAYLVEHKYAPKSITIQGRDAKISFKID